MPSVSKHSMTDTFSNFFLSFEAACFLEAESVGFAILLAAVFSASGAVSPAFLLPFSICFIDSATTPAAPGMAKKSVMGDATDAVKSLAGAALGAVAASIPRGMCQLR